jgi:hypothetical protein
VAKVLRFIAKKMVAATTERKKNVENAKKNGFFAHFAVFSLAL